MARMATAVAGAMGAAAARTPISGLAQVLWTAAAVGASAAATTATLVGTLAARVAAWMVALAAAA